ncbi:unnamed protein product [Microthlaspi erraticum]|uniref:Reverse transcriptase Ty1/copia-type domain-containing protein n=1 Tax=Microthlaspi erraticum TaxID=1685480 RepID=A0A6D2J984_9BRAS|nr:unnamed protein product [Microthlaspi erraticum]
MDNVPYASAVGSLMYAMIGSRPDLAYAVGVISRFMSSPSRDHWTAVKWVLRYLRGASKAKLTFTKNERFRVEGFCDSDYATDLDRRRSVTGFIFKVWGNTVSWRSNLQSVVALSTTEAEYMALTSATKEAIWLKGICEELGFDAGAVMIHCDSQSALALAKNAVHHERTKHIATKFHFIRDIVADGIIKLYKIHTSRNPADFLTKALPGPKFELCRDLGFLVQKRFSARRGKDLSSGFQSFTWGFLLSSYGAVDLFHEKLLRRIEEVEKLRSFLHVTGSRQARGIGQCLVRRLINLKKILAETGGRHRQRKPELIGSSPIGAVVFTIAERQREAARVRDSRSCVRIGGDCKFGFGLTPNGLGPDTSRIRLRPKTEPNPS